MNANHLTDAAMDEVYEVFAKVKPEDTLRHIGNVSAPSVELARVYAFATFQEFTWSEMMIAPRRAIVSVIPIV
jgi:hypothetical protein